LADEPGIALLAARRGAPDLGHEEARVDLLEREHETARARELAFDGAGDVALDLAAQPLTNRACRVFGVGAGIDEERVRVAVDDPEATPLDRTGGEPDHVLPGHRDRVR